MPAGLQTDLVREYATWLRERLTTIERRQTQVLSTPFLDPFHDGIQIHMEAQEPAALPLTEPGSRRRLASR